MLVKYLPIMYLGSRVQFDILVVYILDKLIINLI